eukprot:CAMPEP_0179451696 /NCGR_PEP_ID=MMETSP0799-20121207/35773_1 /TAXON_ID=46947 /ORGANISM="Geminigera cryophila, Strain CCMP2564" /LENGTH=281 /DNA_ID=CAMNT_0021247259 /DNA_START=1 /DNA_END=846 /DNA_ORIENTATION=-
MALVEDFETTIKVIVVGNGGVGKSSMIRRFCTGEYTDTYKKTIGVDFLEKEKYIDSCAQSITFMVWDTAGQEEFDAVTKSYYRGAHGCVIAFSTVDRDSFDAVEKWKGKVEAEVGEIAMVMVQNKVDLIDKAVSSNDEVEALAKKLKLKLYRTCVSEDLNVDKVFEYLGEHYVNGGSAEADVPQPSATPAAPAPTPSAAPSAPLPASSTSDASKPFSTPALTNAAGGAVMGGPADFGGAASSNPSTSKADKKKKNDKSEVIQIHKPKQRTGGKKKMGCSIL